MKSKQNKPITLIWQNLNANVKQKAILSSVSGYCKPGQMLAIMGPSGAGKTTLLSLLASKRSPLLQITGQIKANNTAFSAQQFYNFGVYIYQNDILHEMLTVQETLQFIAKLRIKNDDQSLLRVKEMISTFQLQKCKDSFIGGQFKKGISGGQKKRVCIAVEMISNPSLLILDQPTSGLDSSKARTIIKVLKRLAVQQKKTIIFTLHQPSYLIYQQLDRLILLNQGRTIYQGKSSQIYSYLSNELKITVALQSTISDFFMMQISQFKQLNQGYKTELNYENYVLKLKNRQDQNLKKIKTQISFEGYDKLQTVRSYWFMFCMLMNRQWTIFKRNPMKGVRVILNSLLTVILAGLIFLLGISQNRPQSGVNYTTFDLIIYFIKAQGISFIGIVSCIMSGLFSVSLAFPNDREIYYKQTTSKKYKPIAYLISKILIQAGSVILGCVFFAVGEYFIVGYSIDVIKLLKYVVALISCTLVGNSLGILTGSIFKDAKNASALTPLFLLPMMMFSGLYNQLGSIPSWISWLQYVSPFRYGLHAVLINEYNNQIYSTTTGQYYNYRQDLSINLSYEQNIIILFGLSLLYYTISFIVLKKLSSNLAP